MIDCITTHGAHGAVSHGQVVLQMGSAGLMSQKQAAAAAAPHLTHIASVPQHFCCWDLLAAAWRRKQKVITGQPAHLGPF